MKISPFGTCVFMAIYFNITLVPIEIFQTMYVSHRTLMGDVKF